MITLKITSPCGTYKHTMKCKTAAEAQAFAEALREDGSKVAIIDDTTEAQEQEARDLREQRRDEERDYFGNREQA